MSQKNIIAVVAMSENRVIGVNNQLPWHLSADLKHFKNLTTGFPVLMGRKTYQSIGKPLPNRTNIIISRHSEFMAPECMVVTSIDEAIRVGSSLSNQIFIIGGAEIYKACLPYLTKIHLTLVHHTLNGDAYFPELEDTWKEQEREDFKADEKNDYDYSFITLEKSVPLTYKTL